MRLTTWKMQGKKPVTITRCINCPLALTEGDGTVLCSWYSYKEMPKCDMKKVVLQFKMPMFHGEVHTVLYEVTLNEEESTEKT